MMNDFQRIMLVDDEDDHHLITRMVLRRTGFNGEFITFYDAKEAIEALRNMEQPPDLLLLDINMPGTTGFDMLRKCESDQLLPNHHTLVVVCSSSNRTIDIEAARRARSVDDYVEKSFNPEQYERLRHLFLQQQA